MYEKESTRVLRYLIRRFKEQKEMPDQESQEKQTKKNQLILG
jgi:hypothetical protein